VRTLKGPLTWERMGKMSVKYRHLSLEERSIDWYHWYRLIKRIIGKTIMTDVVLQDSSLSFLYLTCATWRRTSSLDRDMLLCKDSTLTDFIPNNDICSAVGAQPEWRKSQQTTGSRRGSRRWQCKFSLVFKGTVSPNKIWMTMISMNRFNWGHMTLGYWKFKNYPLNFLWATIVL
jgi:hypothetical protein